jgi:hypothetical protein
MSKRYRSRTAIFALLTLGLACAATTAAAQDHEHAEGADHHHGPHFAHPMIAESVSPDTKIRVDHRFFDFTEADEHSGLFEAEYAFHRSMSLEFGFPFSYTASEPGNLEAILKFANYAFEDAGLLLGYGAGLTFPTAGDAEEHAEEPHVARSPRGPGQPAAVSRSATSASGAPAPRFHTGGAGVAGSLGTDAWELSPFVNLGYRAGDLELVGWALLGVPFGHDEAEPELSTTLGFNLSGLYRVSDRFQAILELDGGGGVNGEAVGEDVVNLTPGAKFRLLPGRPLWLGASYAVPLTDEELFDTRFQASAFLHF